MFLFIFESLGTSELILIGIIALIFLGPRKLPSIARTIGKTMADLRNTTNEFRSTWEREVDFEEEAKAFTNLDDEPVAREKAQPPAAETLALPEIKPVDNGQFEQTRENGLESVPMTAEPQSENEAPAEEESSLSDKKSWL